MEVQWENAVIVKEVTKTLYASLAKHSPPRGIITCLGAHWVYCKSCSSRLHINASCGFLVLLVDQQLVQFGILFPGRRTQQSLQCWQIDLVCLLPALLSLLHLQLAQIWTPLPYIRNMQHILIFLILCTDLKCMYQSSLWCFGASRSGRNWQSKFRV